MKLVKVTGYPFTIKCALCGKKTMSDREQFYADLDGEPFKAYYCEECFVIVRQEQAAQEMIKYNS